MAGPSGFYDVTLADIVLGAAGVILTGAGVWVAFRQNRLVKQANEIAEKALKFSEDQNKVALRIEADILHEYESVKRGVHREIKRLVVKVINDGVECELSRTGLRKKGWGKGLMQLPSLRTPFRMLSKQAIEFVFSWDEVHDQYANAPDLYQQVDTAVAESSCGTAVELQAPAITEWADFVKAEVARGKPS